MIIQSFVRDISDCRILVAARRLWGKDQITASTQIRHTYPFTKVVIYPDREFTFCKAAWKRNSGIYEFWWFYDPLMNIVFVAQAEEYRIYG